VAAAPTEGGIWLRRCLEIRVLFPIYPDSSSSKKSFSDYYGILASSFIDDTELLYGKNSI
jgi:hypothetical protein